MIIFSLALVYCSSTLDGQTAQATPGPSSPSTQSPTLTPTPSRSPVPSPTTSATPSPAPFDEQTASKLLDQITDGLQGRVPNKVFGSFDFSRMRQGQLFRQQLTVLMTGTDGIRIHFNVVRAAVENGVGAADVDVEMEATPRDNSVPVHKQNRLKFEASDGPSGWKFTALQPRSFFSLQP